jgi:hypothetical protein
MKHFLLIAGIIGVLAVFIVGCGKSSSDGNDPEPRQTTKTTENAVKSMAPEIEKTDGTLASEGKAAQPAMAETKTTEAVVETTNQAAAVASQGASTVADVIQMKNTAAFADHTRSIIMFEHEKHTASPPGGYGLACGECHHDKNGHPLELKPGDAVQRCMACHDKAERPKKPAGISRENWDSMQLEYYYGAIHANCIDCHRKAGAGPVRCTECHPASER